MTSNAFALTEQMYFVISYAFISCHFLLDVKHRRKRLFAFFAIKSGSTAMVAGNSDSLLQPKVALEYRVSNENHL